MDELKELRDDLNKLLDGGYYVPNNINYPYYPWWPYYGDDSGIDYFDDITITTNGYIHSNDKV